MTSEHILRQLPFEPLPEQHQLIDLLAEFITSRSERGVFLLNGYAGTGKTSVMGAVVRAMQSCQIPSVVLAPTGRAAKVASSFSGMPAFTIHKHIFRADGATPDANFFMARNRYNNTIFIVDEASLITDNPTSRHSLLQILVHYVYSGAGCKMILVGDTAQLPPVGQEDSPAMNPDRLRQLGLFPQTFTLDRTVRQARESGILYNATRIREMLLWWQSHTMSEPILPTLYTRGFDDVHAITSIDLADALASSWATVGMDETLMVTRSNRRANDANMAVRNQVMMAESPLQQGDRLVISKNDYYWSRINKLDTFLANGDIVTVRWVGRPEKVYGRYYVDVELESPSMPDTPIAAKIMLRSLRAEGPNIPRDEMQRIFDAAYKAQPEEYGDIKKTRLASEDPYYNALQAKYAYCVTCHKAQGGQWRHVYIDMGGIMTDALTTDFLRWLYTAMTRATEKIYLVNPTLPLE